MFRTNGQCSKLVAKMGLEHELGSALQDTTYHTDIRWKRKLGEWHDKSLVTN
jgi:hypothetical protein